MRRLIRYGAPSIALLAGTAGLWMWHAERPLVAHPELLQPAAATTTPAAVPVQEHGAASAAVALPMAASGSTTPGPTASPGTAPVGMTTAEPMAARPAASFDVVRVNPQGNAVIAGRAAPNSEVVALDGDTVIGRATADKQGEWVILPSAPLPPGQHTLRLEAPTASGGSATASDKISITVPPPSSAVVAVPPGTSGPATMPSPIPAAIAAAPRSPEAGQGVPADNRAGRDKLPQLAQEQTMRDKSLTVQSGNSLWRIARHSYGAGGRYGIIYSANRDRIGNPDLIYPGQIFTLPAAN